MRVADHILNDFKALTLEEQVNDLLELMEELKCNHLPILHEGKYLGLISEDDLMDVENPEDQLNAHLKVIKPYAIEADQHIYDAIRIFGEGDLSILPVVDAEGIYHGYIGPNELIWDLGQQLGFVEAGSVIVLRVAIIDYHISQIAQIVESEDALILGLQLRSDGPDFIKVAVKINQIDLSRIIKSFERFSYDIVEVYHKSLFDDTGRDRYDALMKYLNI